LYNLTIAKGIPIMFFDSEKISVGVNQFPENLGSFETPAIYVGGKNLSFDTIYPIGSIYMSVSSTNPGDLFGGIWSLWGEGKVPVCVDTNDPDFSQPEKIGGTKTVTLTIDQMPLHGGHVPSETYSWGDAGENTYFLPANQTEQYGTNRPYVVRNGNEACIRSQTAGGNGSLTNLQPLITCFMWKRTG
jgi:hypothetical protein